MKSRTYIVHIAGIVAMILWGMSFIWSTQAYQNLNPTTTILLRLVVATVFFTAILFIFRLNEKVKKEHLGLFALAAMFEPFLYFICEGYGLKSTSPIIGSAIIALIPLVTPIAARIFLKEHLTAMNIVGFIISFVGVIVLLLNKNLEFTASPKGVLFLCGAVLVAVGYSIALMRLTKLYKPLTITWMQNIVGMIYFIPLALIMERFQPSNFANVHAYLVPVVCLGVFCSAIAYALWAFAFSKLGASRANVYSNLIPVFTAIFSYFLAIEALTVNKIVGIVVVVAGLILSQMKPKTGPSTSSGTSTEQLNNSQLIMITSKTNPKIKNLVKLQKASERREQNRILIEGQREIERAQQCGFEIEQLYVCEPLLRTPINLKAEFTETVTEEVFDKIAYREGSDGLLAVAKPKYKSLNEFKPRKDALIIVLETVEKPGNLGAVMRTADAAGVDAVIIADPATDLYNPNAIRASIGCIFSVPVYACSTEECINWLKKNEITIYCTYLKASIDYLDADFRKASALVMGTEATGISEAWVVAADQNIIIPMNGIADSLNVSVTTAIVTFEAVRQRRKP